MDRLILIPCGYQCVASLDPNVYSYADAETNSVSKPILIPAPMSIPEPIPEPIPETSPETYYPQSISENFGASRNRFRQ